MQGKFVNFIFGLEDLLVIFLPLVDVHSNFAKLHSFLLFVIPIFLFNFQAKFFAVSVFAQATSRVFPCIIIVILLS